MIFPHVVVKKWGYERWFANDEDANYCGKELYVIRHHRCSYHYHRYKCETFYLISGKLLIEYGDYGNEPLRRLLLPGECFPVEAGLMHRFTGLQDSRMVEASTFHDDADVERDDRFGVSGTVPDKMLDHLMSIDLRGL